MSRNIFSDNHTSSDDFKSKLQARHRRGRFWHLVFRASTLVGIVALIVLLLNIVNSAFGYVAIENEIPPEELAINGISLERLHQTDLIWILEEHVSAGLFRRLESEMPW